MSEPNGRVKLSVPQVVWGVSVIATVLGAWFNLGSKLDLLRQEVLFLRADLGHVATLEHEHSLLDGHAGGIERVKAIEKRIDRMGKGP